MNNYVCRSKNEIIYEYSVEHVAALRRTAIIRRLSAPAGFWMSSPRTLQVCYNGIGPDSWAPCLRSAVTFCLDVFESDALIHDYEFEHAPRTYRAFTKANLRFAYNTIMNAFYCANLITGFKHAGLGIFLAFLCQLFGLSGFLRQKKCKVNQSKELIKK